MGYYATTNVFPSYILEYCADTNTTTFLEEKVKNRHIMSMSEGKPLYQKSKINSNIDLKPIYQEYVGRKALCENELLNTTTTSTTTLQF